MSDMTPDTMQLRVGDLHAGRVFRFDLRPEPRTLAALAQDLDLRTIRKLAFAGALHPEGQRGWRLEAHLGATVVQDCVATLEPVTTRIEEDVTRRYTTDPGPQIQADEMEMPEDDSIEPLGQIIDLGGVLAEALALALPPYPRSDGAALERTTFAPDGVEPIRDEDMKPFAGLAALKKRMKDDGA